MQCSGRDGGTCNCEPLSPCTGACGGGAVWHGGGVCSDARLEQRSLRALLLGAGKPGLGGARGLHSCAVSGGGGRGVAGWWSVAWFVFGA